MSVEGPTPIPAGELRRLHPLTPLLKGWALGVAALVGIGQELIGDFDLRLIGLFALGALVVGGLVGLVSWWFTFYRLEGEELRIESGVLFRRSRRVRIDRLQAVDVVRPLRARLFGLAELRLEVAGGASTEAPLAYLTLADASRLRQSLLARAGGPTAPAGADDRDPLAERPLQRVPAGRLLGGLVLSTQFLGSLLGLLVAVLVTLFAGEVLGVPLVLPWVLGIATVTVRGFVQQYGFTLAEGPDGLRTRRGLFDLRAQTVPAGRVQGVAVVEPLLWRRHSWVRLEVGLAGYVPRAGEGDGGLASTTLLPVAPRPVAQPVVARVLSGADPATVPTAGTTRRAAYLRPVGWRFLRVGSDPRILVTARGWLNRRTDVVPHGKTQSVRAIQGPLQRRLGLATVHVDTPPGPVHAAALHRPAGEARELLLAQAERARVGRSGPTRPT